MSRTPHPRRWWALFALAFAQFITIMDTSIIGVALPDIQAELGFTQDDLSWVFNAYVVAFGGLLLLGGRLADLYGARRTFTVGLAILAGGSLVAGMAESTTAELVGRAIQGGAAALIGPAALAMVVALFAHDPRELTKALGLFGAAAPAGGTAGVFLGGVLTDAVDWRWTLLINIPLVVAVLAAIPALLPASDRHSGRIDLVGGVLSSAALGLTVFGIVQAPELGWGATQTVLVLAGAVVLLLTFVAHQAKARAPLMPLRIFRVGNLSAANVVFVLLGAAWIPMWFVGNLYLRQVLGMGAFEAGAALLPMTVLIMALMVGVTGRVIERFGVKAPLVTGLSLLSVGLGMFAFVDSDGSYAVDFLAASLVAAAGMSLAYIPALTAGLGAVKPEESGLASGLLGTSYQVGAALGLAVLTAIGTSYGADELGNVARLTNGFQAEFIGAAGIAVAGALAALALIRTKASDSDPEPDPPAEVEETERELVTVG
jgi:EmrB/QacA subfamily drug resistance transporter